MLARLREGELLLGSVLGRSFWCALVVAAPLAIGGCDGGGGGDAAGESEPAPKSVLPPVGFSATADGFTVRLAWSAPSDSAKIVGFEITRNDRPLTSASASATSASDDVSPGKTYRYEIRSKGVGADSDWVSDEVKVKTPSLKEARVEGDFGVTVKIVSQSGYASFEKGNYGWHFKPKCRHGACDIVWRDVVMKNVHAVLKQKGKEYSGTYHGFFGITCGGTHSSSTVDVSFKVMKARALAGEWRATKLEGTVENSEVSQFGCVSGSATVSIKGSLRGRG
jgi:hypothetical protein